MFLLASNGLTLCMKRDIRLSVASQKRQDRTGCPVSRRIGRRVAGSGVKRIWVVHRREPGTPIPLRWLPARPESRGMVVRPSLACNSSGQ